jgi:hypothetical protein
MTKMITQNDLVRFLYGETGKKDERIILESYAEEKWVEEELNKLFDMKNLLDQIFEEPSDGCTEKILDALNGQKEGI